ncbi:MAG: hypothetical protein IPK16_04745 [Anaerolineales bacterium]|nr:hypothetical protein [Anaerolineales bacterium]
MVVAQGDTSDLSTWDSNPPVGAGVHVVLDLVSEAGDRERLELDVVPDNAADFDAGLLGIGTPLGKAIAGRRAGTVAPYRKGDLVEVAILAVTPTVTPASDDAATRRQANLDKARQDIARTNAEIFSTTFDSKWGGYDAAAVDWTAVTRSILRKTTPEKARQFYRINA